MKLSTLLFACLLLPLAGCVTPEIHDTSDAGRRKQIVGHWYDEYMQGMSFAIGDTVYRPDGTFLAAYESVSPGESASQPTRREKVQWSGKWRIEGGQLIEDITAASDPARAPADRPLVRAIAELDRQRLSLRSENGNVNAYARKRMAPPTATFKPVEDER